MTEILAVIASLLIAGVLVYFVDKKFGGDHEGYQG
jgi:hypothetical protein